MPAPTVLSCALLVSIAASDSGMAGDMELSLLPSSLPAAKGGRCLDGSMAGFYTRQGGSADTFTIWLEGGGLCACACVPAITSRLQDALLRIPARMLFSSTDISAGACYDEASCKARAKGKRGSSKSWPKSMPPSNLPGTSLQSADCSINPAFCNATAIYVPYCTGDVVRARARACCLWRAATLQICAHRLPSCSTPVTTQCRRPRHGT